jgi:hypothetical protein
LRESRRLGQAFQLKFMKFQPFDPEVLRSHVAAELEDAQVMHAIAATVVWQEYGDIWQSEEPGFPDAVFASFCSSISSVTVKRFTAARSLTAPSKS